MEKINLSVVRGFSDSITVTFNFVKQEFVPFIKVLGVIVIPLILVDFLVKGFFLRDLLAINETNDLFLVLKSSLITGLGAGVIYMWTQIVVIAYLRVYYDKYRNGDLNRITSGEVWQVVWKYLGSSIVVSIAFGFIVILGTFFFVVPGIYFAIALIFLVYCIMIKGDSADKAFGGSMALVKGRWWNVLGYVLVLQMIISVLAYIFNIPYLFVTIKETILGESSNLYGTAFSYYLANLGQYLAQSILVVGVGIRFFSYWEEREHATLLDKIGKLGQDEPKEEGEDEGIH